MGKLKDLRKKIEREANRIGEQVADAADKARQDAERMARSTKFDGLREEVQKAFSALEKQATEINMLTQVVESAHPASDTAEVQTLKSTNEQARTLLEAARAQEALVRDSNHSSTTIEDAAKMVQETMTQQMQTLLTQAKISKQTIDSMSTPMPDQAARIAELEAEIAQLQLQQQLQAAEADIQTPAMSFDTKPLEDEDFEYVEANPTVDGQKKLPLKP